MSHKEWKYTKLWHGHGWVNNHYMIEDFKIEVVEVFSDRAVYSEDLRDIYNKDVHHQEPKKEKWYSKFNKPVRK